MTLDVAEALRNDKTRTNPNDITIWPWMLLRRYTMIKLNDIKRTISLRPINLWNNLPDCITKSSTKRYHQGAVRKQENIFIYHDIIFSFHLTDKTWLAVAPSASLLLSCMKSGCLGTSGWGVRLSVTDSHSPGGTWITPYPTLTESPIPLLISNHTLGGVHIHFNIGNRIFLFVYVHQELPEMCKTIRQHEM